MSKYADKYWSRYSKDDTKFLTEYLDRAAFWESVRPGDQIRYNRTHTYTVREIFFGTGHHPNESAVDRKEKRWRCYGYSTDPTWTTTLNTADYTNWEVLSMKREVGKPIHCWTNVRIGDVVEFKGSNPHSDGLQYEITSLVGSVVKGWRLENGKHDLGYNSPLCINAQVDRWKFARLVDETPTPTDLFAQGNKLTLSVRLNQDPSFYWEVIADGTQKFFARDSNGVEDLYNKDQPWQLWVEPPKFGKGFKIVRFDGTSHNNYAWPIRPQGPFPITVEANLPFGKDFTKGQECPKFYGDGLCVATTEAAAVSGGLDINESIGIWLEYDEADVLGRSTSGHKTRVSKVRITGYFNPLKAREEKLIAP